MFESMAGQLARTQIDDRIRYADARRKDHGMHSAATAYTVARTRRLLSVMLTALARRIEPRQGTTDPAHSH